MKKCPYRIWVAVMIFNAAALNYAYRVYFQLSLVAMIDKNEEVFNETSKEKEKLEVPDYGPRYKYSSWQEGLIVGAYFYGQTITSIPGGPIAEIVGPWISVLFSSLSNAAITIISLFVISDNWVPLFVCRFFIGLLSGVQYPALQCLIGRWAPPHEKGKFSACLMGNVFGSIMSTVISGFLIPMWGWQSTFYGIVIVTVTFGFFWFLLISDYPSKSWWCSQEESQFIMDSHEGTIEQGKVMPPFLKIATSIPFLVLVIGQFGSLWGLNLIVTSMPKFMAEVLHFKMEKLGTLAALPSLARLIMGFIFGITADYLLKKQIVKNKAVVRKGFVLFSHLLPGVTLFCYTFIGANPELAVSFLVIMLGLNGATVVTMLVNNQDLAPNFAGTLYGIMNCFGSMPGFIIPSINSKILEKKSDWPEWTLIFSIGGAVYVSTGILFILLGSTKLQPWNEKKSKEGQNAPGAPGVSAT
ncbi:sialin-like [Coccinella septempunctata]|uniref:sialin-like n=1 Tax=Coccinella septempunctata TaxID=41139 RepID=UPI001D0663C4|nr:sialin-like [Coccinella septempunctata]